MPNSDISQEEKYAIETRYPPEVKTYSREQAEEAVKLALEVETAIKELGDKAIK